MPPVTTEDEKQTQIDRGDYVEDDDYEELEEEEKDEESEEDEEDTEEDEGEDESEEEENSEEDDDESDSEVDSEEDEGDEGSESDQRVPISRLNRVIAQREREKERTEWLEDQLERLLEVQLADKNSTSTRKTEAPKPEYNFEEAEEKYADLLIEGEPAKAAKLRAEIDQNREEKFANVLTSFKEELSSVVEQKATTSVDEDRFNTLVENFENKHPFLDIESDDYNEEAVETVNTLMLGFLSAGDVSKSQAIKKAVNKVAPMYEKPVASKKDSTERAKKGRKRNVNAMKQTPAKIAGKKRANRDVSDFNVETMSDKEYGKLTAREKAELRGDIVG